MIKDDEKKIKETSEYGIGELYKCNSSNGEIEIIKDKMSSFDTRSCNFHLCPKCACQDIKAYITDKRSIIIDYLISNRSIKMVLAKDIENANEKDTIYVSEGHGKIGGRNEFKGLFKYILAKKNGIKYELNFMRFFIDKDKKVNCILKAIQFDRCVGKAVNADGICYPESTIDAETEILDKHQKREFNVEEFKEKFENGKSFCFNPGVNFYDSEEDIATAFIDFINKCDKQIKENEVKL